MILVTGATGNVGRHLVDLLLSEGAPLRAPTRNPSRLQLPAGAEVMGSDLLRLESMTAALTGVSAVFLNLSAVGGTTAEFLAIARKQGVRRVVLLSSSFVQDGAAGQPSMLAQWHKMSEDMVRESGLEWTVLRPSEFDSNALWIWGPQLRTTGRARGAYGMAAAAPVHERDIAAVAVRALLTGDHIGRQYVLTGPESLTQYDRVRVSRGSRRASVLVRGGVPEDGQGGLSRAGHDGAGRRNPAQVLRRGGRRHPQTLGRVGGPCGPRHVNRAGRDRASDADVRRVGGRELGRIARRVLGMTDYRIRLSLTGSPCRTVQAPARVPDTAGGTPQEQTPWRCRSP